MPTGIYIRRKAENNFVKEYPFPLSAISTEWLAYIEDKRSIDIQHARNGGEYPVGPKRIAVDGFFR